MITESERTEIKKTIKEFINNNNIIPEFLVVDKKLSKLEEKIVEWLTPIPAEDRSYFLHLFQYFQYFNRGRIIEWFEKAYVDYMNYNLDGSETLFLPVCSFGGVMNGALSLFDCMNEADVALSKNRMAAQPRDFYDENIISEFSKIVLIDDIVGSGDTLIDFLERTSIKCPDFFLYKSIYILPIFCLEKGKENVLGYAKDMSLDITFLHTGSLDKIFDNPNIYPDNEQARKAKKVIKRYEKKVASKDVYTFGYKRSETLIAFYFNTPNNTLSTFHEKNEQIPWYPVFPRKKNGDALKLKETSLLHEIKRRKKERNDMKYQLSIKVEEEKRLRNKK